MMNRAFEESNMSEINMTLQKRVEEKEYDENIHKKQFNSVSKTTIKNYSAGGFSQESIKITLAELKSLKGIRKQQRDIMVKIDNVNIQDHVQNQLKNYESPICVNCTNRKADRVCINRQCGSEKYMQLICGKCHYQKHQSAVDKPELDIEEYFIKLSTFLNEVKSGDSIKSYQRIDMENLFTIFQDIYEIRTQLDQLKSNMQNLIENQKSSQEMQGTLEKSISQALSLCEQENIQDQLLIVKKNVLFKNNKFIWNDLGQKYKQLSTVYKDLDMIVSQFSKKISKSYICNNDKDLNLDDLVVRSCIVTHGYEPMIRENKGKDGEIRIISGQINTQFFLDYPLEFDKKYKLRFRFESKPHLPIIVGVMPKNQCSINWVYDISNQHFCKRFLWDSPKEECSRIIKGVDLSNIPIQGQQIEMRIDLEDDYMDFYDFPDIQNVNASHADSKFVKEEYVIAFAFFDQQTIGIEQFSELSQIKQLS